MAGFDTYKDLFPHARLTRSQNGVLEVVLHTDGATLVFNGYTHEEFVETVPPDRPGHAQSSGHPDGSGRGFPSIASIPRASISSRRVVTTRSIARAKRSLQICSIFPCR